MAYEQKFALVRESLISYFKERLLEKYNRMFDLWLMIDAGREFGRQYKDTFNEYFGDYITDEIGEQLWITGKNIIYAIKTFIAIKGDECKLNDIIEFVEKFVCEQLDDFDNSYDTTEWFNNGVNNNEEDKEDDPV